MLLACDRRESITRIAGENIWAFQISGKSAGESCSVLRKAFNPPGGGKHRLKLAEFLLAWISTEKLPANSRALPRKEKSYEMNKCLTLVHLTSAFRIHSLGSEESKGRDWGS